MSHSPSIDEFDGSRNNLTEMTNMSTHNHSEFESSLSRRRDSFVMALSSTSFQQRALILAEEKRWRELSLLLQELPMEELQSAAAQLSSAQRMELFRQMPEARLFQTLRPSEQSLAFMELDMEVVSQIMSELSETFRFSMIATLAHGALERITPMLNPEELEEARFFETFAPNTVGKIMRPTSTIAIGRSNWSLPKLAEYLKTCRLQGRETNIVCVLEAETNKFVGTLEGDDLLLAAIAGAVPSDATTLESFTNAHSFVVPCSLEREELVQSMRSAGALYAPVVDSDKSLVGLVTLFDVLHIMESGFADDIHGISSMEPLGQSYSKSSVYHLFRKRILWLLLLLVINLGSSLLIGSFEEQLEANIALAFFIPLLIDMGGNTGGQSAGLIIAALASKDISIHDWRAAVWKETKVALALCPPIAFGAGLLGYFKGNMDVALVVGFTMISIIFLANLLGMILPIIATSIHLDPAVTSSPVVTTLIDITGLAIYFGIASTVL